MVASAVLEKETVLGHLPSLKEGMQLEKSEKVCGS